VRELQKPVLQRLKPHSLHSAYAGAKATAYKDIGVVALTLKFRPCDCLCGTDWSGRGSVYPKVAVNWGTA
jgi:hypothetical protein